VHQRELHGDTPTFASALRAALREAPKVILVGEMRTREYLEEGGREGQSLVDAIRNSALDGMQHFDDELEKLVRSLQPGGFLPADEPLTMDFRVPHQTAHSVTMI
jgi:hypothetical protein